MYYHNEAFSYVMRNFPEKRERPEELKDDLLIRRKLLKPGWMNETMVAILISMANCARMPCTS